MKGSTWRNLAFWTDKFGELIQIGMVLDKIGLARNTIWFQIDNQDFLTYMFFIKFR